MPSTTDIRRQFLEFFEGHGHSVLPSSSLVPQNDPTLMFANAGMNQFKNIFTGQEAAPTPPRAATSQKCVRAGGKHNDLDNVGYTARHHTFFEMLGNFSFGDYFKEQAISHAWELITKVWGVDKNKLCVTVYHTDDEAFGLWKKIAGLPESRIIRIATNDNFWAMGDTGPCGPCSEIFYDHGAHIKGGPPGSADADGDRFIEIWNLVFMQYEQRDKETRVNLPKPSIDTGMGLERVTALLQGKHDNYDIDLFQTLIKASQEFSKNNAPAHAVSHRVIADHLRSSSFLIADGVLPSNEGRGYVLRRIMRRAMRHAHMLGCKAPLMHQLVPTLVAEMGSAYPELKRAEAVMIETLKLEEEKFKETLERGLKLLEDEQKSVASGGTFPGAAAFKLYDTYGFPLDLTQDILRGENITVDLDGFNAAMDEQKAKARAAWKGSGDATTKAIWFDIKERVGATEFLGYNKDQCEGIVTAIANNGKELSELKQGESGYIFVNQTPFYGESGGQVGDRGSIQNSKATIEVVNTIKPLDEMVAHEVHVSSGTLKVGDTVTLAIDTAHRNRIRANHSATHLLHAALREKLGEHVTQKGSLVDADRLRFDITHPKAIARDDLVVIEAEVNRYIAQKSSAITKLMNQEDAIKAGAMALFGEKYGAEVRVLTMGKKADDSAFSVELCGGTHVTNTGDIGLFKIVSEGSVSSGVRRIEAVTGEGVRGYFTEHLQELGKQLQTLIQDNSRLRSELKQSASGHIAPPDLIALEKAPLTETGALYANETAKAQQAIQTLQNENKSLSKELVEAKKHAALSGGGDVAIESIGSIKLAAKIFGELDAKSLRDLASGMQQKHADAVSVLLSSSEGKASIIVAVGKELAGKVDAPTLVRAAAAAVGGQGGGGRPDFAQAGGPEGDKLEAALAAVRKAIYNQ